MMKLELLPMRDCEAGYSPGFNAMKCFGFQIYVNEQAHSQEVFGEGSPPP